MGEGWWIIVLSLTHLDSGDDDERRGVYQDKVNAPLTQLENKYWNRFMQSKSNSRTVK